MIPNRTYSFIEGYFLHVCGNSVNKTYNQFDLESFYFSYEWRFAFTVDAYVRKCKPTLYFSF